ncbi:EF-Tu/IF-2/RF-3 family GTPase [Kocuria rhizophila]|nr:EF-Tu/IF-2/RF-3 family GTPase [Kocuria rhizophila]
MYSGKAKAGEQVLNSTKGKRERVGKLFQMHSNRRTRVEEISAGHVYAAIGLKDTTTGGTPCDSSSPIMLESMSFPSP